MSDPIVSSGIIKELTKEPIVYVIAVIIGAGVYLMKGENVGPTWAIGLSLAIIGVICFLVKLVFTFFDESFKKKYTELIDSQSRTLKSQTEIIKSLSTNTMDAYNTMANTDTLSGGYSRSSSETTSTSTEGPTISEQNEA